MKQDAHGGGGMRARHGHAMLGIVQCRGRGDKAVLRGDEGDKMNQSEDQIPA